MGTLHCVRLVVAAGLAMLAVCPSRPAGAQALPSEPLVFGGGRVVVGGDISLTASCSRAEGGPACTPDTGYFNYSDYEDSLLRMARVGLSTSVRLTDRLTALGEVRIENTHAPRPYAAYLRFRPFEGHDFDIQAGRIPSVFGAFARRAYSTDKLLIGYPLAYQYLLSLRYDAVPASADDLLRMRGRGWLSSFAIGSPEPEAGLPIANAFRWDTGVQAHGRIGWFEAAASVSNGSLTRPLFRDDNAGKQVAGRASVQPVAGLVIGASASRGPFVDRETVSLATIDRQSFVQRALGADLEYSFGHYLLRFEAVSSTFDLPTIGTPLRAVATMIEGRYKVTPRLHVAARADHLGFSRITSAGRSATWEAPVTRWEAGTGFSIQRNLQLRASIQHNTRDGGRVRRLTSLAAQLLYWF
ncbi:MAG: hypothetical protein AB7H96_20685 [Vicinamibacterales bacterium]